MSTLLSSSPLVLPCGAVLKNRLAKSAMSENMASKDHHANVKFERVYERWGNGGAGLLVTGNVMIDSSALGEPDNVVIDKGSSGFEELTKWAEAGTKNGTQLWMQINHPGKQSPKFLSSEPVAPSAVAFEGPLSHAFNCPRALTETEIYDVIERFAYAAKVAKETGFTGVQIHGAHGYLVSQFLSPRHNIRTDKWGGSLENRMRFVVEIYLAMRREVGSSFPISVKINSADFQKGGFSEEDSLAVAQKLSEIGIDLIEISGGTYEAPEMTGQRRAQKKKSTVQREAYFLEYCEKVCAVVKTPLMLTGGFRTIGGIESALKKRACDLIGLARSVALNPNFPKLLLSGEATESQVVPLSTGLKFLDKIVPLEIIWYTEQLQRMGRGNDPIRHASVFFTIIKRLLKTYETKFSTVCRKL